MTETKQRLNEKGKTGEKEEREKRNDLKTIQVKMFDKNLVRTFLAMRRQRGTDTEERKIKKTNGKGKGVLIKRGNRDRKEKNKSN